MRWEAWEARRPQEEPGQHHGSSGCVGTTKLCVDSLPSSLPQNWSVKPGRPHTSFLPPGGCEASFWGWVCGQLRLRTLYQQRVVFWRCQEDRVESQYRAWDLFRSRSLTLRPRAGRYFQSPGHRHSLPHHPSSPGRRP